LTPLIQTTDWHPQTRDVADLRFDRATRRESLRLIANWLLRTADAARGLGCGYRDLQITRAGDPLWRVEHSCTGERINVLLEAHQQLQASRYLDAACEYADAMLADALGSKKQKELRRQRSRLADDGALQFAVAEAPHQVAKALDQFLKLEAAGWKGKRGTALGSNAGDARFIKDAAAKLAANNNFKVATLTRGAEVIAVGLAVQHGSRAYFYKVAYDEALAKWSPGVQLTLEFTKHFCADATVADVDSTATADHPMINHIWRKRLEVGEVLLPTGEGASLRSIRLAIHMRRVLREGARRIVNRFRG
jgi:hypothetical protein